MALVANQMAVNGHHVHMILIRNKPQTYPISTKVNIIQLSYDSSSKIRILLQRLKQIRLHAKVIQPDCIVSFMWDVNVMTLISTLGLHARVVISERAFPRSPHRSRWSRFFESSLYGFADAIVYQTEGARTFCPYRFRRKSCVIPNAVAAPTVLPYLGERTKRIVSVGRLTEQKNYPMLIRAFAIFTRAHEDYRLQIFGDGKLKTHLRSIASELGIAERVDFCGFVNDVSQQINDASMFVMSSDYEGISNAMAEAMALGLPTVCTDCPVGGAALMIEDGINGLLVPVGSDEALADAMARIADDADFARSISDKAKEVVERFSAKKIGIMWEEVMRGEN